MKINTFLNILANINLIPIKDDSMIDGKTPSSKPSSVYFLLCPFTTREVILRRERSLLGLVVCSLEIQQENSEASISYYFPSLLNIAIFSHFYDKLAYPYMSMIMTS